MARCLLVSLLLLTNLGIYRGQILGCLQGQWQCDDGRCIPDVSRCDGQGDCLDGSDEMDCPGASDCPRGQFSCVDTVGCVDTSARCDGQIQCPTGSDEENCPAIDGCLESEWTCQNRICIPEELRCNGQDDCMDNSDEDDCGVCTEDSVQCPGGTCLSAEKRCDGQFDCSDGSDEPLSCGRICAIKNGGCSHMCSDEPWGTLCTCPAGYALSSNGLVCEDLDECAAPLPPCSHSCMNTDGSYDCFCSDGFKLQDDNTCLASGNGTRLLMVQRSAMGLLSAKSQQFEVVQTSVFDPVALAFDVARGWYYWADRSGKIYKSDGQQSWTAYNGDPGIISLACDWLNGNLFWTNQETKSIHMQAPDGRSYTIVLSKNINPSELVLVPVESSMFWINAGLGDRETIEKSWMDGSERSSLTVITAQSAHSLTTDVAAMRLYWISDFKKSIETVMMDGSGRYSFTGLFNGGPALSLAVFESSFYWVDDRGLWQVAQSQPSRKKLLFKTELPLLAVYHELQQPQGFSACAKSRCQLCQLTKSNPGGYTCTCPTSKLLLPDGSCDYPRFVYNTAANVHLVEYRGREIIDTQLFATKDGILSFDLDWQRDWFYWANQTGDVQRTTLKSGSSEVVPTALPVCFLTVDQRRGSLFWVSCDHNNIGTAVNKRPQILYHTTHAIRDLHLDWMANLVYWVEEDRIFSMSMTGGKTKELLQVAGGFKESVALDLRANSLLWNSKQTGLTKMSLLQERSHTAGRRWDISGSVAAALEPYLLTVSDNVINLWDQRDGSLIQDMTVNDHVSSAIAVIGKLQTAVNHPACNEPFVLCRHSSVCLSQAQLCDGKQDCPEGDDEEFCVGTCPSKEDFRCRDQRSCISRNLVCDGRSNCRDGSDEVGCSTMAPLLTQASILKCRLGSKPCSDGKACVLYSHVCDGEEDCSDGSDELECDVPQVTTTTAKSNDPLYETPPAQSQPACISPSIKCPSALICITPQQICNGKTDCPDGFDENNCLKKCPLESDFLCNDHKSCVSISQVCDGHSNCYDGSDEAACSNVAAAPQTLKCRLGSKLCKDGSECVLYSHVCDGERDCRDGSDELGCESTESTNSIKERSRLDYFPAPIKHATEPPPMPPCTSPSVLCPGSSVCLSPEQRCDGKRDCPDGSDEKCLQRCRYRTDFLCKDRQSCISKGQVCDGRADCSDGSDEVNCPSVALPTTQKPVLKCRLGSRLCQDGTECVLNSHLCDGERDCQDGSDELGCDSPASITEAPTKPPCTSPSIQCPGSSVCLSPAQICDGKRDCPDGSDEKCLQKCPSRTDFLCKDRRSCVSRSQVCDGRAHCHDGSDEVGCSDVVLPTPPKATLKCRLGSKLCQDGTECVLYSHVCDGEQDCRDGSDELGCDVKESAASVKENSHLADSPSPNEPSTEPPTIPPCTSPSVQCPGSSICLSPAQICDGKRDCPDGSDEKCLQRCPYRSDFLCKDRRNCIPKSKVCDGRSDCHDSSDEVNCPSVDLPPPVKETRLKCRLGSRPCQDGTECVLYSHVCDGERDCQDGSDELGCDVAERDASVVENPKINNPPVTDPPTKPPCTSPSVQCPGSSICLSPAQICDGKRDCPDGSDEKCLQRCPNKMDFLCQDRRSCIPRSKVCDGRSDCHDSSDEINCSSVDLPAPVKTTLKCRLGSRLCQDGSECVLNSHVCDGERDCQDGSDELGCESAASAVVEMLPLSDSAESIKQSTASPTKPPCTSPSILCPGSSICLSPAQICDRKKDCPDGSDEKCVQKCPSWTDFRCKDRRSCISKGQVCDGRADCHDGSDEVNCPSVDLPAPQKTVLKCRLGSRLCQDGTECVLNSHVCDGERDCQDGSDELGCDSPAPNKSITEAPTEPPCTSPSVQCPGSSLCLSPKQICDGKRDCPDGSDEKCLQICRSRTDFLCKDRRSCVSGSQVCDGRAHCHDGSDELGCTDVVIPTPPKATLKCRFGSKLCKDGTECVLYSHVCDGERDCQDGSDEMGCDAVKMTTTKSLTRPPCSSPSVLCPGSSVCILPAQFCDGREDCPDGSDEDCVKKCADQTDFLCKDRRSCVSRSLVCDGSSQCLDGSDELNCPTGRTAPTPPAQVLTCRFGSKLCDDGKECVLFSHLCDGEDDCLDGSDEWGCARTCKRGEFQCAHGKMCIPEAQVCDGKSQCRDNSDEMNCWKPTKSCEHRCADGKRCLPKKLLCDGERDCPDGSDELGCDAVISVKDKSSALGPASVCVPPSVLCPRSSLCVLQQQLCDGKRDCPDGSDESGCVLKCEKSNDFLCKDQKKCIQMKEVCDGQIDCPDGSDETGCSPQKDTPTPANVPNTQSEPLKCRRGSKPCEDGLECVMYSHVCDGEKDCKDGSDEVGCVTKCKEGEFRCAHGSRCVQQNRVCDGQYDCQDGSDEKDCSTRIEGCHHQCDNKTRCIPDSFLCDGEKDCADGSDEHKCGSVTCSKDEYRCLSGQCVSEGLRCDGYADCFDRSDEAGCPRPPRCPAELKCPHSHECLQKEWLCDGEEDCKDGTDEMNCNTPPAKCRSYQWQCRGSTQCIPVLWRCDGTKDCYNGMDEDRCTQKNCPFHLYQCGSGECIDTKLLCNGLSNCADGSDEGVGCGQRNCSSPAAPQCDHHCVNTPMGPACFCISGFRPQYNGQTCVDVDECNSASHAVCEHTCLNTRGSYTCHCYPGFYLEPDNKSCKTKDEPFLLASVQSELLLFGVHSGILRVFSSVSQPVFSLDYHWAQQRVYWLSPYYQSIRFADMNNPNDKRTLIKGVKSDFLAVDWVGNNLYWVDGLVGQILALRLSNTTLRSQDYTIVLGEDLEQPSSLVLLPHRGLMLWSEIGSKPQIEQSGMDGSRRKVVVSSDLSWPVSLAFDLLDDRMYWADEKLRCIGSASLDGDDIRIMQLAETPNPFSVVVFNDRVFWSDTKRRAVRSAEKNSGKDQKVLLKRPGQPFGLKLVHALSQPAVSQPCDQLSCSHICLLAPAVRVSSELSATIGVCRCPKGLLLSKDKITCSVPTDSSFILFLSRNTIYQIYLRSLRRDGVSLKKMPNNRPLALPNKNEALELDVSLRDLSLYVAYSGRGSVDVLRLSSSRSRQGLTRAEQILQLKDGMVTALAVDWVTLNLYWSSSERPDIHVTSRYPTHTTSLLQESLMGTTSIALHPPTGRLCYTAIVGVSETAQTEVICAWMDGRNKATLWRKSTIPTSLVFSTQGNTIYWADAAESMINSIGLDGTGFKQFTTGPDLLVSFTHTANIFLWVTLGKDVTRVWFTDGLQPKQLWFETKTSLVNIRAFSNDTQTGENSCSKKNGGCEHLCLPYPGGRTCKCGRGFLSNGVSCSPLPSCPAGEKSCLNGEKCISSSKFCDNQIDCPDQSDERDCPPSNTDPLGSKASDDQTPQSSNTNNSILSVKKSSASCDLQHCSGHGKCIAEGEAARCQCLQGYKGKSCEEADGGHSHVAVIFGVFFLIVLIVTGVFIFSKRREWAALRKRSTDKENLMANMGLPEEETSDSEELESPVDLQPSSLPPSSLPLVTVPEKDFAFPDKPVTG